MLRVVIYDLDQQYLNRLINQLSSAKQSHYDFSAYSDFHHLVNALVTGEKVDVLITCNESQVLDKCQASVGKTILLTENRDEDNSTSLFKYQAVHQFISDLDKMLGYTKIEVASQGKAKVTLVVSAEGKSGRSSLATAAAKLSGVTYKTVLLTFEVFSAVDQLLDMEQHMSMTDLFYTIKKKSPLKELDFNNLFYLDDQLGFYAMKPLESIADLQVISVDDLNDLFTILMEGCGFKRIIIDAGSVTPLIRTLAEKSHEIWIVQSNDQYSGIRGGRLLNELRHLVSANDSTIKVIANTTTVANDDNTSNESDCILPYEALLDFSYKSSQLHVMSMNYYRVLYRFMTGA